MLYVETEEIAEDENKEAASSWTHKAEAAESEAKEV